MDKEETGKEEMGKRKKKKENLRNLIRFQAWPYKTSKKHEKS